MGLELHQVKYLGILLFIILFVSACENTRHSIGVSTKPFSKNFEEGTKLNYKIIFGKVRNKNEEDD